VSAGDRAEHPGIHVIDVTADRARQLRQDASAYRCPSWSPRGDRLTVAAYQDARSALVIIDTSGVVRDTVVQSDSTYLDCPQWSPRGDEILFTIFHGGGRSGWERPAFHSNLAVVSLSSRVVTQLTHDRGLTNYGRWARDGDWIVFQSDRHATPTTDPAQAGQMLQNLEIWIMRRDGTRLRRLTTNTYFDAHPSW
jgi:Tol biopolymer transport system component